MAEDEKNKRENQDEESLLKVGVVSSQAENVQRYGEAIKEHFVAYTGKENETGKKMAKSLKGIAESKLNEADKMRNIKQQAGFAAEVKTQARENAESIISGNKNYKTIRTDDMTKQSDGKGNTVGGRNEPLYDIAKIDENGIYIAESGRQLKYVGGDAKSCCEKLLQKKFDKYRDADVAIEIPSDFYEDVKKILEEKKVDLNNQIEKAKERGNIDLVQEKQKQLDRIEKTDKSLRQGKLTNTEAIEARLHPIRSTVKDTVDISHQAGMEAVKSGVIIGGAISIVQNLVEVTRGEKEPEEAIKTVAKDTASSAAISYGTGFTGSMLKGAMQNAKSKTVQTLSKTNLPSTLVMVSFSAGSVLKRYYKGELSGVECLEELGAQGTGMISSALFATIGQAAIPIPVVGGMIGGMLGYAVASASYKVLLDALKEEDLAARERARIEKECNKHIILIQQYRNEMEKIISQYLSSNMEIFNDAFFKLNNALKTDNIDEFIGASNMITQKMGKRPLFSDFSDFDDIMKNPIAIKI